MTIKDKKALDRYRNQLLRRAEAIQRRLDDVTRAAREELVSIRDQIYFLDSTRKALDEDDRRANILDRQAVTVKTKVKTVLIVEKQSHYAQLLVRQTQSAGFKPVVAATAEGGLRKATECHPDLILLGLELPDMDGLKFVSEIRQNSETDQIPIVAISALPHLKQRCLELGCDDFLLKPVRMIDLVAHARKYLHSDPKVASQPILPKKFTRFQIECRMDELSIKFQRTQDKKIMAQISTLSRLLAKMENRLSDPKNRQ